MPLGWQESPSFLPSERGQGDALQGNLASHESCPTGLGKFPDNFSILKRIHSSDKYLALRMINLKIPSISLCKSNLLVKVANSPDKSGDRASFPISRSGLPCSWVGFWIQNEPPKGRNPPQETLPPTTSQQSVSIPSYGGDARHHSLHRRRCKSCFW